MRTPLPLGVAEVPGNPALSALLGRRAAVQARAVEGEVRAEQLADVVHHRVDHGNGRVPEAPRAFEDAVASRQPTASAVTVEAVLVSTCEVR